MLYESELKAAIVSPDKEYEAGRCIVTLAGGLLYFVNAYINCRWIRDLGCTLPIHWYYLGDELYPDMLRMISEIPNVHTHRLPTYCIENPAKDRGGWQHKIAAIIDAPQQEVLFLDADSFPLRNPESLFDSYLYRRYGFLLWYDNNPFDSASFERFIRVFGLPCFFGWQYESGQLLVDKARCQAALRAANVYNINASEMYKHVYGDKDLFFFGARAASKRIISPPKPAIFKHNSFIQHDTNNQPAFLHRIYCKFNLSSGAPSNSNYEIEKYAANIVEQLRTTWIEHKARNLSRFPIHSFQDSLPRLTVSINSPLAIFVIVDDPNVSIDYDLGTTIFVDQTSNHSFSDRNTKIAHRIWKLPVLSYPKLVSWIFRNCIERNIDVCVIIKNSLRNDYSHALSDIIWTMYAKLLRGANVGAVVFPDLSCIVYNTHAISKIGMVDFDFASAYADIDYLWRMRYADFIIEMPKWFNTHYNFINLFDAGQDYRLFWKKWNVHINSIKELCYSSLRGYCRPFGGGAAYLPPANAGLSYAFCIPGRSSPLTITQLTQWANALPPNPVIFDLGVLYGRTTIALACRRDAKIYAVDTFEFSGEIDFKYPESGGFAELIAPGHARDVCTRLTRPFENITLVVSDVLDWMPPEPANMIWIDDDHSYRHVREELEKYWQYLKPGGIFCGHDFVFGNGVAQAVTEFAEKCGLKLKLYPSSPVFHKAAPEGNNNWQIIKPDIE